MSMEIKITLTDAEAKGLAYAVSDPQEWVENAARAQAIQGMDAIFQAEVQRMVADPDIQEIPADRDAIILAAEALTLAERQEALLIQMSAGLRN